MKTLSRSEIRRALSREYIILEFGERMSPGNSTGNNNSNTQGSLTDVNPTAGVESFDIKIDKKNISKKKGI